MGRVGYGLTASLRDGLRLPMLGMYTEKLPLNAPDLAGILATFETELSTALGDEM